MKEVIQEVCQETRKIYVRKAAINYERKYATKLARHYARKCANKVAMN